MRHVILMGLITMISTSAVAGVLRLGSPARSTGATVHGRVDARLAVMDLVAEEGLIASNETQYLGDIVRSSFREALSVDQFVIMTRENVFELLPADIDLVDCAGSCAVETGRLLGCDYVVTGSINRFGGEFRATLVLHDTESANLLASEQIRAMRFTELEVALQDAARNLARDLSSMAGRRDIASLTTAVRRRASIAGYRRTNNRILIAAATASLASAYFHANEDADRDQLVTGRSVSLGVAGVLLLWRALRVFGGPADRAMTTPYAGLASPSMADNAAYLAHTIWF